MGAHDGLNGTSIDGVGLLESQRAIAATNSVIRGKLNWFPPAYLDAVVFARADE